MLLMTLKLQLLTTRPIAMSVVIRQHRMNLYINAYTYMCKWVPPAFKWLIAKDSVGILLVSAHAYLCIYIKVYILNCKHH